MKSKIGLFLFIVLVGGLFKFSQGIQRHNEAEAIADNLKELGQSLTINFKGKIISEDQLLKALSNDKYAVINNAKRELFPDADLLIKVDVNARFNVSLAKNMSIFWEEK